MSVGWEDSAKAWIESQGEHGDFGRQFVLDAPMMARVRNRNFEFALDVGCGEGRFCRMLQSAGIQTIGIDPTEVLIEQARSLDPAGDYRLGRAEAMRLANESFDLVVSYLTLIDIADARAAIAEMERVLRPGGTLLIANLNPFNTAGMPDGWRRCLDGRVRFTLDNYLEERAEWVSWRGIRIQNWHRPLSTYMQLLLEQGLILRHFEEPAPTGGDPKKADLYRRAPYFHIMEWQKPGRS